MDGRRKDRLIAIVDDDESVRRALGRVVRADGYAVATHESGAALLASLEETRPDCIVLDLNMPGIDGFGVLHELPRRGCSIPVIVITANHEADAAPRTKALGAVAFMSKPVESAVLLAAIAAAVSA